MITNVYIDGFNLFHGCLQKTPYRWLNPARLIEEQFPLNKINLIRYFTAPVEPRLNDSGQRNRQEIYWRALKTVPKLTIHKGHFQTMARTMRLVTPLHDGTHFVEVLKSDEKGSDVNLASYLMLDACGFDSYTACEAMIVISNDADLATPVKLARQKFGIKTAVLHPLRRCLNDIYWPSECIPPDGIKSLPSASIELKRTGAKSVLVDELALYAAQFDDKILDMDGRTIHKPTGW